ncbi:MAG: DNA polymerase III subunit beta [Parcubacteria group bacterium]|nr:DNA polymerase III subunit beta [Parcubacteria group bacterium]
MKISCTQENLIRGLSVVSRSVGKDSTLPVLANILLSTENKRLKLSATNLEIGSTCLVGAKIEKEGEITIPAQLISNYVNNLPSGNINIEVIDNTLNISSTNSKAKIKGINSSEFPLIPKIETQPFCQVSGSELKQALNQTIFAAALEESRPEISGIYLKSSGTQLIIAATDSYRLAEKTIKSNIKNKGEVELIVPATAMQELNRIVGEEIEAVSLSSSDNQIKFSFDDVELISRLVEGQYPDYQNIIPKEFATEAVVDVGGFISTLRTSSFFSQKDSAEVVIKINNKKSKIEIIAETGEVGKNVSQTASEVKGDDREISFNPQYLLDSLLNIETEKVKFMITADERVGALQPISSDKDNYIYIVMPIVKK